MGHITGPHLPTLLHQTAKELADRLRDEHTDLALLCLLEDCVTRRSVWFKDI